MILKVLHNDKQSWWMYDNLEKVRYSNGKSDFVFVSGVVSDSSDGSKEYDYRIVYVGDMDENEICQIDYQWVIKNKSDVCPDVTILDFNKLKPEGVSFINWVIARNRNNEEKMFVFNTLGFILNDEGKTIEKI